MVETGYTLLSTPEECHILSKFIFTEEKKIHLNGEDAKVCLRTRGHSSRLMALCLNHIQPLRRLRRIKSVLLEQPLNWILGKELLPCGRLHPGVASGEGDILHVGLLQGQCTGVLLGSTTMEVHQGSDLQCECSRSHHHLWCLDSGIGSFGLLGDTSDHGQWSH